MDRKAIARETLEIMEKGSAHLTRRASRHLNMSLGGNQCISIAA